MSRALDVLAAGKRRARLAQVTADALEVAARSPERPFGQCPLRPSASQRPGAIIGLGARRAAGQKDDCTMISTISGKLIEKKPTSLTVEVGGVGYMLHVPLSTYDAVGEVGDEVRLLTHLKVRDDAMELYGFANSEERGLFLLLLSVNGVGPKAALNILSSSRPAALHEAIGEGDEDVLRSIPGIGKKMAGRLIVELKEKLSQIPLPGREAPAEGPASGGKVFEDAVAALTSLGYTRSSAVKAVEKAQASVGEAMDLETVVKKALGHAQS